MFHYRLTWENLQLSCSQNRGIILKNNLFRGPSLGALLLLLPALIFVISLFWHIGQAPAQEQVYSYTGPAFEPFRIVTLHYGPPYPPCVQGGYVTGSIRFHSAPAFTQAGLGSNQIHSYGVTSGAHRHS